MVALPRVDMVSSRLSALGEIVDIMRVLDFPPRDSYKKERQGGGEKRKKIKCTYVLK